MNIAIVFILVFQRNRTDRMSLHMGTSSIWVVQQWLCPDGKAKHPGAVRAWIFQQSQPVSGVLGKS